MLISCEKGLLLDSSHSNNFLHLLNSTPAVHNTDFLVKVWSKPEPIWCHGVIHHTLESKILQLWEKSYRKLYSLQRLSIFFFFLVNVSARVKIVNYPFKCPRTSAPSFTVVSGLRAQAGHFMFTVCFICNVFHRFFTSTLLKVKVVACKCKSTERV